MPLVCLCREKDLEGDLLWQEMKDLKPCPLVDMIKQR